MPKGADRQSRPWNAFYTGIMEERSRRSYSKVRFLGPTEVTPRKSAVCDRSTWGFQFMTIWEPSGLEDCSPCKARLPLSFARPSSLAATIAALAKGLGQLSGTTETGLPPRSVGQKPETSMPHGLLFPVPDQAPESAGLAQSHRAREVGEDRL